MIPMMGERTCRRPAVAWFVAGRSAMIITSCVAPSGTTGTVETSGLTMWGFELCAMKRRRGLMPEASLARCRRSHAPNQVSVKGNRSVNIASW